MEGLRLKELDREDSTIGPAQGWKRQERLELRERLRPGHRLAGAVAVTSSIIMGRRPRPDPWADLVGTERMAPAVTNMGKALQPQLLLRGCTQTEWRIWVAKGLARLLRTIEDRGCT